MNPLDAVAESVTELEKVTPALLEACTDPQALDMAELLFVIQQARIALQGVERDVEHALGRAMTTDMVVTPTMRVERSRTADRKSWDHESWQRDIRQQALRAKGFLGAHVITADGEELPAGALYELLTAVQSVHGSTNPRMGKAGELVGGLRAFGLDPANYCETSPGRVTVAVTRMADETETEAETDAA